jgi:hypothetical protein
LRDSNFGYEIADCRLFPVTAEYAVPGTAPLVTVIADATNSTPRASTVATGDGRLSVTMPSGRRIHFVRVDNQWTPELESA